MKKRIILSLVLIFSVFVGFCQKRNMDGKKVLAKIDVVYYNKKNIGEIVDKLYFYYDKNFSLQKIDYTVIPLSQHVVWEKKNGKIIRSDNIEDTVLYAMTCYGLIDTRCRFELIEKPTYIKHKEVFVYNKNEQGRFYLSTICSFEYKYNSRTREQYEYEQYYYVTDFKINNGGIHKSDVRSWNYQKGNFDEQENFPMFKEYSPKYKNDVNFDITRFIGNYDISFRFGGIELLTEWTGLNSEYLIEKDGEYNYEYVRDFNGNINTVKIYKTTPNTKKLKYELKLFYVYK